MATATKVPPSHAKPVVTSAPAPQADRSAPITPTHGVWKGALAYLLTWLTGLIFFFTAEKYDRFTRFHSLQAIGIGVVAIGVWIALLIPATAVPAIAMVVTIWWAFVYLTCIVFIVGGFLGKVWKIPVIGDLAAKHS